MISDISITILSLSVFIIVLFIIISVQPGQRMQLIHRLYLTLSFFYMIWAIAVIIAGLSNPHHVNLLFYLDCITYIGASSMPVIILLIALSFVNSWSRVPKGYYSLFVFPIITVTIAFTNPLHHLFYKQFSLHRSEVVFGPYLYVNGIINYFFLILACTLMISFAVRNPDRLYVLQTIFYCLGNLVPLIVNIVVTMGLVYQVSFAITPISFLATMFFHGMAIYKFHLLDIRPIATKQVLDWISDGYLILSESELVLSYNKPFYNIFGSTYGIVANKSLKKCIQDEDVLGKTAIYNLMTALDSCRQSLSIVSYEQAVTLSMNQKPIKYYYVVDVSPLLQGDKITGFIIIFKDITQVKKSMQQLHDSQTRLMERERLAFLGQMVGGLAHNLKTPIMCISGCSASINNLIKECRDSLECPQVINEDYIEIYGEVEAWLTRIRDSCSYMSDIISAIKDQATNASTSTNTIFTLHQLIQRSSLLMRHELQAAGCTLVSEYDSYREIVLSGDINNLIQVLNNLISNAIYSQKLSGGGEIFLGIEKSENHLSLYVKDTGPGINPQIKKRLFREMTTDKGTYGTGLGLYISNAVVRGKFGGTIWFRDNPEGGAIFGIALPLESITFKDALNAETLKKED
ncbi:MAG: histidine kinase N-terminal 7TM domain-containing protein [Anaerovoracaceae bacterium]